MFYFPGCGSERLFSQVGLATQAMLWHAGVQTVLPPGYLCCGYPQRGSGQFDKAEKIITDNRVLFHRVANTLNYLDIKTVVVSCGTCYDQLQGYQFEEIFPGCRIIDIHEYLLEKGITLGDAGGGGYLYHDPCHSPMKLQDPMKTVKALVGDNVLKSERCCGESGTLGVTRPDIATQVRFRKEEELRKDEAALRALPASAAAERRRPSRSSPRCPSCLQGLSRYGDDLNNGLLEADYIVVEMAQPHPRRGLDAGVRGARQRGRHRARAGLARQKRLLTRARSAAPCHPGSTVSERRRRPLRELDLERRDAAAEAPRRPGEQRERALAAGLHPRAGRRARSSSA